MANKYKITPKYTIPTGVAGNYRKGHAKPEGVVIHASANPNAGIDSEIDFMTRNYRNAFTHAWAGHDKIIEISNTDYACWGAGAIANKRFAQIETTEDKRLTKQQKLQVIDHAAYWAAVQLVYYKLPCKDASKDGNGTVWGHVHVSKYLGGTDHTDPIAYFNSVGVSWNDFYKQVERYYNTYKKGTSDQVKSLDGTQGTVKPSTPTPSKPNKPAPSKPKPANKANLKVDGYLGPDTVKALQHYFGLIVDGEIWGQYSGNQATKAFNQKAVKYGKGGSPVVKALQKKIGVTADGIWGANTTRALQRYLGTPVDGIISRPSTAIKELQRRLNNGTF